MASALVQKLTGVRDLKKILETTVKELGESFSAESCQLVLSNPLDPNVTSICEYRASKDELGGVPTLILPLTLQGKAFGHLCLARQDVVGPEEVNAIRVVLAELGDIIRHAQINDVVQRDTFRDTFLVEIGNVMAYSLGIGDALFMVVNILGKVLQASRCLFICTDDTQAGWKCYEFWQQTQVKSCQEYCWPTTDSPLVAQVLLSDVPLQVFEGQQNSYVTPVQEELQFIGARSALGVALRSTEATHGAVILQQCDHRRAWTRGEIDMVQSVADKVAEALVKLPAEKRAREPIMQLHQRTVAVPEGEKESIQSVRRKLKGALGQQAIPVAQKTSQPPPPPAPAAPEPPPAAPAQAPAQPAAQAPAWGAPEAAPQPAVPDKAWGGAEAAPAPAAPPAGKSLSSILGGIQKGAAASTASALDFGAPTQPEMPPAPAVPPPPAETHAWGQQPAAPSPAWGEAPPAAEPAARQPTGEWGQPPAPAEPVWGQEQAASQPAWGQPEAPAEPVWGQEQAWGETAAQAETAWGQPEAPAAPGSPWGNLDAIPAPGGGEAAEAASQWGNLDAIPTPGGGEAAEAASQWGNLDAIPTPSAGPGKPGLGGAILAKPKGPPPASPLMASFHKDKSKYTPELVRLEGAPIEIDEAAAQAKLKQILSSANPTSDYIFATPGLDARMLGRIDGWVSQIEQKDKYLNGHARQVAEYATAVARQIGMPEDEVNTIRLAALVHDVGKLGAAPQVLQKPDEELSDNELLLMMKHPLDGAELLESFPELKHLAPIVRSHHEEFDGNGYPAGLKGEEIPLAARIVHVADSYHLLTSPLRMRPGLDPQQAQQEMTRGAGKQWDPRLVEALILSIMQGKVPAKFD
ncbi:MAG TPA: HD domain-containing phosphohydrolase [Candidatus Obscuribacterales bacterium]